MKSLNTKKSLQILALSASMLVMYQNCGPGVLNSSNSSSVAPTNQQQQQYTLNENGVTEFHDAKAVGVSYSENTYTSMLQQTGVVAPSTNTRNAVTAQFTKLPETGRSDSVTAPMFVSITTVAGELCNDLVAQERALAAANRRFFGGVDFNAGPASISAVTKDDMIRRLARSFWARNESLQEKALILAAFNGQFTSATTADTPRAAMFLCSAMLSSLDAHKY